MAATDAKTLAKEASRRSESNGRHTGLYSTCPLDANCIQYSQKMVLALPKTYTQNIVKKWSRAARKGMPETYSKNSQKMVAGPPEGHAVDIL